MKKLALLSLTAVLVWVASAQAESIKLLVSGVHCNGCGGRITAALNQVPGATVKGKISKVKGSDVSPVSLNIDLAKADVGDVAKAAAAARTPHLDQGAPSVTLVIAAVALTDENAKTLADALKDVKGVDAGSSKADVSKKEIHVKLNDKGGAKLADIQKALMPYTK